MFKNMTLTSLLAALILSGAVAGLQAVLAAGGVKIGRSAPLTGGWAGSGNDFNSSTA